MLLEHVPPAQAVAALRALRTMAVVDGPLGPHERRLLARVGEPVGVSDPDDPRLTAIEPDALADAIPGAEARRAVVRGLVVTALIDAAVHDQELELAKAMAAALECDEPAVERLAFLAQGKTRKLAGSYMRGSFIAAKMKRIWKERGLSGAWTIARSLMRLRSGSRAARYRALGELPPGTLGREFHDHCVANELAFPGEPSGTPEILVFHDIGHVLAGYGTDVDGELHMAGFEYGFLGDDAFSMLEGTLLMFHFDVEMGPGAPHFAGKFDFDAFAEGAARGRAVNVDLRYWDYWPAVERSLTELRAELGVPG